MVQTSEDGYVKFTGHDDIIYDVQDRDIFAKNSGLIVLAGDGKTAKGVAKASNTYILNPGFFGIRKQNRLTVRVPVFYSDDFGYGFDVSGYGGADCGSVCSFGVSESGEASAPKI